MDHAGLHCKIAAFNQACSERIKAGPVTDTNTQIDIAGCTTGVFAKDVQQDQVTSQGATNEIIDAKFTRDHIYPTQNVEQQCIDRPVR